MPGYDAHGLNVGNLVGAALGGQGENRSYAPASKDQYYAAKRQAQPQLGKAR